MFKQTRPDPDLSEKPDPEEIILGHCMTHKLLKMKE
jgi:hypothetical protein